MDMNVHKTGNHIRPLQIRVCILQKFFLCLALMKITEETILYFHGAEYKGVIDKEISVNEIRIAF